MKKEDLTKEELKEFEGIEGFTDDTVDELSNNKGDDEDE